MKEVKIPSHVWPFIKEAWYNYLTEKRILVLISADYADLGFDNFILSGRFALGGEDVMFVKDLEEGHV